MDRRGRIELACLLEAVAPKVGNVHRGRDRPGLRLVDLIEATVASAPILARAGPAGIGRTIRDAVAATRAVVSTNANLGIVLLLAPLCAVPEGDATPAAVATILERLTVEDARLAYEAIRRAEPGGMGVVATQDVFSEPTVSLLEAMRLAADRDLIARQYSNGFADLFAVGLPALARAYENRATIEQAIVYCQLCWLAHFPDSLIVRKCGRETADNVRHFAERIVNEYPLGSAGPGPWSHPALDELDQYLTADGNRRNPGTTADLVAASLFWAFETGVICV